jgi:hypothetical protein
MPVKVQIGPPQITNHHGTQADRSIGQLKEAFNSLIRAFISSWYWQLDHLCQRKTLAAAVDLVEDDDLHFSSFDIGNQPLQGLALHRAAREASVVVRFGERDPTGMPLARDRGLASLTLGVERIELRVKPVVLLYIAQREFAPDFG